jgi:hemoglobin/transferrin/lactoferrin receptor protein
MLIVGLSYCGTALAQSPAEAKGEVVVGRSTTGAAAAIQQGGPPSGSSRTEEQSSEEPSDNASTVDEIIVRGMLRDIHLGRLADDEISFSQPAHLSDLLRPLPGVEVGGTHSLVQRINIRGLDDRDLTVFIDGAPQLNFLYHHIGNVLVNPDFLQSIEVENGATRAVYGGLGGVVRFTTKDAKDFLEASDRDVGARATLSGGVNAPETVSGMVYGRIGRRADALVYAGLLDHDDFEDGAGVRRRGVAGRTSNFAAKVGYDLSDTDRFEAAYDRYEDRGDYAPRPDLGEAINSVLFGSTLIPTEYGRENITLAYRRAAGVSPDVAATVFRSEVDLRRDERGIAPPFGENALRSARSVLTGADLRLASRVSLAGIAHQLAYGGEASRQRLAYASDLDRNTPTEQGHALRAALFVEDEIAITRALSARAGLRWNRHEIEDRASPAPRRWDDLTYSLGIELRPYEGLSAFANTTTLFKGPELPEPFTEGGAVEAPNPALQPETGRNTQLGFRFGKRLGDAHLRLAVTAFRTRIEDFAVRVDVPGSSLPQRRTINIGDVQIEGVEASAEVRRGRSAARFSYASADFDTSKLRLDGSANAIDVVYGLREIGDTFGLELEHARPSGLELRWSSAFVRSKRAYDGEIKDGYAVHGVSVRRPRLFGSPSLTLVVGIENLFDADYVSHASRTGGLSLPGVGFLPFDDREPGRSLRISLTSTL